MAGQTDKESFRKVAKKVLELRCICAVTDAGGLGEAAQGSSGIGGRTHVRLFARLRIRCGRKALCVWGIRPVRGTGEVGRILRRPLAQRLEAVGVVPRGAEGTRDDDAWRGAIVI
jgi:hypothetical protein